MQGAKASTVIVTTQNDQGPCNLNPGMDKSLPPLYNVWWNHLSIPKFQRGNRWSLEMDK